MNNYDTITEALTDLKSRGFTYDFNLQGKQFHCPALNKTYCFEGASDPADEAVVYAIAADDEVQCVFVNGYGTYADTEAEATIKSLRNQQPK